MGFSALRFPLLWERIAPHGLARADWAWSDQRLARLRQLGIRPIAGLLHHGSGPAHTSLLDPDFPQKLAAYAGAVARRYPWLEAYTPVNEPLTTARFSGLYGHWYPHGASDEIFARALVQQCRGVALAMQAIRAENPRAQLIQTEDLGRTHSTEALAEQAEFENQRRWLTFDLLCGRLDHRHPLWGYLLWAGIGQHELAWFLEHPCPPDIIGGNYYLTSERFLDERLERYPAAFHGSNGRQAYADVEAVRVLADGISGLHGLLQQAWQRYKRPLAVTEIHNGCTREEQLRWLLESWHSVQALRRQGVDVRAVTAWSLLGAYDWNSLLTRQHGHYEPGAFDVRSGRPRATALARLITNLAHGRPPRHPVLAQPGWWRRPQRLLYEPARAVQPAASRPPPPRRARRPIAARPLLILGAGGALGRAFRHICELRGLYAEAYPHAPMDAAETNGVSDALARCRPWAVVDASRYLHRDNCRREPQHCFQENTLAPALLADVCAGHGIQLLTFSSALVFDGAKASPYVESDAVRPQNVFGHSKAQAEQQVLRRHPSALVVRTGVLLDPWDERSFVARALQLVAHRRPFIAAADATISPTFVPDLVHAALDLLIDGESGLWHLANVGSITWADLARHAARPTNNGSLTHTANGATSNGTTAAAAAAAPTNLAAPWPHYTVLGSERATLLPDLHDALRRYLQECEAAARP